jgi:hypothetical protein
MKRFAVRFAVLAAFGVALVVYNASNTTAANLADPEIKEVMQKVNGKGGICGMCKAGLKAEEPKWDELAEKAKDWVPLAKALGKNDPPKGDKESWKKLTDGYAKAAEDLEKACKDKDVKAANAAMKTLTACAGCHTPHRPKSK